MDTFLNPQPYYALFVLKYGKHECCYQKSIYIKNCELVQFEEERFRMSSIGTICYCSHMVLIIVVIID